MTFSFKQRSILPGFGLSLGFTVLYLCLIVLIPLSATFLKTASLTWNQFWNVVTAPRALASYRLSFGASAIAASINLVFGLLVAWVLVRYSFPGRRLLDSLVDLPFALPTAVAGIALTAIYSPNGWIGQYLQSIRHQVGVLPTWSGDRPYLHRPPLRRSNRAASAGRPGQGNGRSRGKPRGGAWQTVSRVVFPAVMPLP